MIVLVTFVCEMTKYVRAMAIYVRVMTIFVRVMTIYVRVMSNYVRVMKNYARAITMYVSVMTKYVRVMTIYTRVMTKYAKAMPIYTIRLKFSNFFIHHYFQNQMFENFTYAFNMSSDAQIHVSRRVCVLFSRPRVATLRLKNHANHVPSI